MSAPISRANVRGLFDWALQTHNLGVMRDCLAFSTLLESACCPPENWRKGKWVHQEYAYAVYLKNYFHFLAPKGTSLRDFLAKRLRCEPMRITKKMSGLGGIGKMCSQGLVDLHGGIRCGEMRLRISFIAATAPQGFDSPPPPPPNCADDAVHGLLLLKSRTVQM